MAKSSKSIKLTPGKQKQLAQAVADLKAHYGDLLSIWRELPETQRTEILAQSPILAGLREMTEALHGG